MTGLLKMEPSRAGVIVLVVAAVVVGSAQGDGQTGLEVSFNSTAGVGVNATVMYNGQVCLHCSVLTNPNTPSAARSFVITCSDHLSC